MMLLVAMCLMAFSVVMMCVTLVLAVTASARRRRIDGGIHDSTQRLLRLKYTIRSREHVQLVVAVATYPLVAPADVKVKENGPGLMIVHLPNRATNAQIKAAWTALEEHAPATLQCIVERA